MHESSHQRVAWEAGRRRVRAGALVAVVATAALAALAGPPALQALREPRAVAAGPLTFEQTFPARHGEAFSRGPLDAALARARAAGQPVLLYFSAEWCTPCQELDAQTFPAPTLGPAAARFVRLKVDATDTEDEALADTLAHFGVEGLPTVVFLDAGGTLLPAPRVTGFLDAPAFVAELQRVP